ncbi:hypothetical protein VIGAN_08345800 [Vigna angularis var. angularis]|uniref:Uncharacterized protein n=1 Tax=Vigna angularis var. angularis TaxID=157739 RepID=A0A0S3SUR2_PHAAN|nr:hypothetical protein VIGAN_08345800 [Vigna angularis var. angularis]
MSSSNLNLPSSTRTVKSILEVEAFALRAEDLKFVSNQFKRLHSKTLQHAFRYYSWRAWGPTSSKRRGGGTARGSWRWSCWVRRACTTRIWWR